jgi:hypothetical protein
MQDWSRSCLEFSLFEAEREDEEDREVEDAEDTAFRLYALLLKFAFG